jgi:hypothetical protein
MKLVIDSGATSHFVTEEIDLPKKGKSDKEVFLPDNSSLQASYKTELPFEQLSNKAREADILPGLKTSLISINKLAEEGYTMIFHPGEEGVTVHKKDTITIVTTEPPYSKGANQEERSYGQHQHSIKRKRNEQRSGQTMHMIYHPSNKLLDTSTQWQDSQSKTHGSKQ